MTVIDTPPEADEPSPRPERSVPNLRAAMRTARVEEAERSQVMADLRGAEMARLEILRDALEPVLAQVPGEIDSFDAGLMPGLRPRLFIDMIAFIEMGHDKRTYRFVQDTRNGRVVLAETDKLDAIVDAVTAYIARRLVDREKAMAAEPVLAPMPAANTPMPAPVTRPDPPAAATPEPAPLSPRPRRAGWGKVLLGILFDYLGIVALLVLLALLARLAFTYLDAAAP